MNNFTQEDDEELKNLIVQRKLGIKENRSPKLVELIESKSLLDIRVRLNFIESIHRSEIENIVYTEMLKNPDLLIEDAKPTGKDDQPSNEPTGGESDNKEGGDGKKNIIQSMVENVTNLINWIMDTIINGMNSLFDDENENNVNSIIENTTSKTDEAIQATQKRIEEVEASNEEEEVAALEPNIVGHKRVILERLKERKGILEKNIKILGEAKARIMEFNKNTKTELDNSIDDMKRAKAYMENMVDVISGGHLGKSKGETYKSGVGNYIKDTVADTWTNKIVGGIKRTFSGGARKDESASQNAALRSQTIGGSSTSSWAYDDYRVDLSEPWGTGFLLEGTGGALSQVPKPPKGFPVDVTANNPIVSRLFKDAGITTKDLVDEANRQLTNNNQNPDNTKSFFYITNSRNNNNMADIGGGKIVLDASHPIYTDNSANNIYIGFNAQSFNVNGFRSFVGNHGTNSYTSGQKPSMLLEHGDKIKVQSIAGSNIGAIGGDADFSNGVISNGSDLISLYSQFINNFHETTKEISDDHQITTMAEHLASAIQWGMESNIKSVFVSVHGALKSEFIAEKNMLDPAVLGGGRNNQQVVISLYSDVYDNVDVEIKQVNQVAECSQMIAAVNDANVRTILKDDIKAFIYRAIGVDRNNPDFQNKNFDPNLFSSTPPSKVGTQKAPDVNMLKFDLTTTKGLKDATDYIKSNISLNTELLHNERQTAHLKNEEEVNNEVALLIVEFDEVESDFYSVFRTKDPNFGNSKLQKESFAKRGEMMIDFENKLRLLETNLKGIEPLLTGGDGEKTTTTTGGSNKNKSNNQQNQPNNSNNQNQPNNSNKQNQPKGSTTTVIKMSTNKYKQRVQSMLRSVQEMLKMLDESKKAYNAYVQILGNNFGLKEALSKYDKHYEDFMHIISNTKDPEAKKSKIQGFITHTLEPTVQILLQPLGHATNPGTNYKVDLESGEMEKYLAKLSDQQDKLEEMLINPNAVVDLDKDYTNLDPKYSADASALKNLVVNSGLQLKLQFASSIIKTVGKKYADYTEALDIFAHVIKDVSDPTLDGMTKGSVLVFDPNDAMSTRSDIGKKMGEKNQQKSFNTIIEKLSNFEKDLDEKSQDIERFTSQFENSRKKVFDKEGNLKSDQIKNTRVLEELKNVTYNDEDKNQLKEFIDRSKRFGSHILKFYSKEIKGIIISMGEGYVDNGLLIFYGDGNELTNKKNPDKEETERQKKKAKKRYEDIMKICDRLNESSMTISTNLSSGSREAEISNPSTPTPKPEQTNDS